MTNSSAPPSCSITSSDTINVSSLDTITLTGYNPASTSSLFGYCPNTTGYSSGYLGATVTIGGNSAYSTIAPLTTTQISSLNITSGLNGTDYTTFTCPQEWVNCFPDFDRIEKMCEEYPGLKIAFEKFKTTYKLVKDHYDTPEDKRPRI